MVRSTFASFVTAHLGLSASQRALDVTGQNITNVNTIGFTRQRLDLVSFSSGGYSNRYAFLPSNDVGQGVRMNGIAQLRDPFLDVRFRREHAKLGEVEAQYSTLSDLEAIFNEITIEGLAVGIDDFITQLHALSQNTGNVEFDSIVRSSADMLTKLFNSYAKQVAQVREQETYQLENIDIPRVNTILESITELNKSIREDQIFGNRSLELLDQRNLLIDELSQYMKIDVVYTPIEIMKGIVVEDVEIFLRTEDIPAEQIPLIFNQELVQFSTTVDPVTGAAEIFIDGTVNGTTFAAENVTEKLHTGVLKGILDMLNKSGPFDTPASDQKGIGYYEKTLDVLAQEFARVFNEANAIKNAAYDPLDPLSGPEPEDRPLFVNGWVPGDDVTGITAANIAIAQAWQTLEYGVTATQRFDIPDDKSGANDNILYMITLFDQKLNFETPTGVLLFNGTIQEYFAQTRNTLALDVSAKNNLMKNHGVVLSGVLDLREGVSGVSLDEEGINLIRFQKSYNAAARFMTTLDEALDKLINGTGIVGR